MTDKMDDENITVNLTMMVPASERDHFGDEIFDFTQHLIECGIDYVETIVLHKGGFGVDTSTDRKQRSEENYQMEIDNANNDPAKLAAALVQKRKGKEITEEQFNKITQKITAEHKEMKKLTPSKSSEDALAALKERMKKRGK